MSVSIDQVTMWLMLDKVGHVLWSSRAGWHLTLCGTWTPNGETTPEEPLRSQVCKKCRLRLRDAALIEASGTPGCEVVT